MGNVAGNLRRTLLAAAPLHLRRKQGNGMQTAIEPSLGVVVLLTSECLHLSATRQVHLQTS